MRIIVFWLACVSCASNGCRLQMAGTSSADVKQLQSHRCNPMSDLATLLLALNPAHTFQAIRPCHGFSSGHIFCRSSKLLNSMERILLASGSRSGRAVLCDGGFDDKDLNWLQTRLHLAVQNARYDEAIVLRDRIRRATDSDAGSEASWSALGMPDWLSSRLADLDFMLPTRVQVHALRALEAGGDGAVCAPTGSGKTLSYLVPVLAQLSDDLLAEDMPNFLASLAEGGQTAQRVAQRRVLDDTKEAGDSSFSDIRVPTPAVLIVVPTRELGVQVSMQCYRMLGGGVTNPILQPYADPSRFKPGAKANLFSYKGPRRVKVAGLWDEQTLYLAEYQDLLKDAHVVVGTPEHIVQAAAAGYLRLQHIRSIVIDEADACFAWGNSSWNMEILLRQLKGVRSATGAPVPQTVLVGATVSPSLVQQAEQAGWVKQPALVSEFGIIKPGSEMEQSQREEERFAKEQRVPAGSSHEYIVIDPQESFVVICRLLRELFEGAEARISAGKSPPRVIVFAASADAAIKLAKKLQGPLFGAIPGNAAAGLWGLSVFLPSAEINAKGDGDTFSVLESNLRIMKLFSFNHTSVLVTTAAATRGLDFPQVTDVLNVGLVGSPADYVHRAGRVGRIGQLERGSVISVLSAKEVPDLLSLGKALQFQPRERAAPAAKPLSDEMSFEDKVQALSDIYYLRATDDDDEGPVGSIEI